jgi:hypothetical protein
MKPESKSGGRPVKVVDGLLRCLGGRPFWLAPSGRLFLGKRQPMILPHRAGTGVGRPHFGWGGRLNVKPAARKGVENPNGRNGPIAGHRGLSLTVAMPEGERRNVRGSTAFTTKPGRGDPRRAFSLALEPPSTPDVSVIEVLQLASLVFVPNLLYLTWYGMHGP